jgi:Protein of unknown function, DUF481
MRRDVRVAGVAMVAAGLLSWPVGAGAQAPSTVWERSVELSGNYLYGNTDQAILSARTGVVRNDSSVALRMDTRFLIGVTDREGVGRVMDRRSWVVSGSVDFRQYSPQSQFLFGSYERSHELRIDRRLSGGIGQKLIIAVDSATKFDVSLGILGEQSVLPQAAVQGEPQPPALNNALVRLSGRLRYRRSLTARMGVDHTTWYRPEVAAFNRYLASSVSALSYSMSKRSHLQLSLQNDFDSLARSRGSRSNQNGQVLVGASTKF